MRNQWSQSCERVAFGALTAPRCALGASALCTGGFVKASNRSILVVGGLIGITQPPEAVKVSDRARPPLD